MNGIEVCLVGNLTRDVELRYTQGGRGVGNTAVAVSRRWQQNGEWVEETSFVDLTIWGTLGENAAASLLKGTRVVAQGRMQQRSWETEEGEKRYKWECTVDAIGPDLRWATAMIEKVTRETAADRESTPTPQRSVPGDTNAYGDQEPF